MVFPVAPDLVFETLRMVGAEHFDIRTATLALSLVELPGSDVPREVHRHITDAGRNLVSVVDEVARDLGVPVANKRISVTPVSLIARRADVELLYELGLSLDAAAKDLGVDYVAGFTALVHKGATRVDAALMDALPRTLVAAPRLCGSLNVASTRAGINMDAVARTGELIAELGQRSPEPARSACARFVAFANAVEDNPFVAGAFTGVGEPDASLHIGISGPGVIHAALRRLFEDPPKGGVSIGSACEVIKRMAFKVTRAGELIGRVIAGRLGVPFGVVDLSLAPTPAEGDSVADIIQILGIERVGAPGSTAALMLLTDAVKRGGAMASSSVGGLSGAFIPLSEDAGMVAAAQCGALRLEKLEAMTSVCSVGLDMVALPGDTPASTLAAIVADQAAIGVVNGKTTAARLLPMAGCRAGDVVPLGGLLGNAVVMEVSAFSSARFMSLGGRIPAPLHAFRN